MSFEIRSGGNVRIYSGSTEPEAVRIAVANLERDLRKVFPDAEVQQEEIPLTEDFWTQGQESVIVIQTLTGKGKKENVSCTVPDAMREEKGRLRKEAFQLKVENGVLFIRGTDRRGTTYGIYTFCEQLGVSPWYFFADVPVKSKQAFSLEEGYCLTDWPSVEYRGIFINDEEELEAWVQNYMGEPTIGVKSYEKIFELLLRLRANYIWPAMHVNSFNQTPENGALAERMGIVVGTSHCDMLMRSNNREWKPWIQRKGYQDAVYDYSVEGRNREILKEYWRESVEQNRDYEVCYTLGMRGIHDSGFETKGLEGKSEEEIRAAKVALLEQIIADQREILRETLARRSEESDSAESKDAALPMMTFIPYKEVLELYDNGLKIPEDMTLVWANDNYGYIRRYPSETEKQRRGGNGIYYHNSYWAPPSMSYVFLCSIPLAHTRNELQKAWNEGIRKLWVLNSGAMKPLEQEITFFLRLAWEIGKPGALTENVEAFTEDWINRTFCGGEESARKEGKTLGREVSLLLNDFSQLTNVRKIENMDYDAFSQTAYGDEAAVRIHRYEEMFRKGNALYTAMPKEDKDAFYQLVLMRIHAAYFTNLAYYYGDRSTLMYDRGNMQAAAFYTAKSGEAEDSRRRMLYYYNHIMSGGKWKGILNPEGFPPPRAAMMPVCTPPLKVEGAPSMRVDIWNEEKEICFVVPGEGCVPGERGISGEKCVLKERSIPGERYVSREKWIEIGNQGTGQFTVRIQAPQWVELSETRAVIQREKRILLRVRDISGNREGEILVENVDDGSQWRIPVRTLAVGCAAEAGSTAIEEDGLIVLEAGRMTLTGGISESWENTEAHSEFRQNGMQQFRLIPRLGRMQGSLLEACVQHEPEEIGDTQPLCCSFFTFSRGEAFLEIHRFPSLNSVGRLRLGIALDDEPLQVVESLSNDEWRGSWKENVLNNVDRLYLKLHVGQPGMHRLSVWAIDRYFAFSRLVVYTKSRKENNLAGIPGPQALPEEWNMSRWCREFYGNISLSPRPVYYADRKKNVDSLTVTCREVLPERYGETVEPVWYLTQGQQIFTEKDNNIRIDAASVLAGSRFAWTQERAPLWRYCASESYGRSGLAMYIRKPKQRWQGKEAPSLNYRLLCTGGSYTLWMLSKFNVLEEGFFSVGVDGEMFSGERLYENGGLWRYEAEQIYRWVPACCLDLEEGEHVLRIYALASGMRYDRFYLTKGTEQPPLDTQWHSY